MVVWGGHVLTFAVAVAVVVTVLLPEQRLG